MTNISYIHGIKNIPLNEFKDRGNEVINVKKAYIPYLQVTEGEANLLLLKEQLKVYAAFYPEYKDIKKGISMVDNAIQSGVHNGIGFVGVVPDSLQKIAQLIRIAVNQENPASKYSFNTRNLNTGINEDVVNITTIDEEWKCQRAAVITLNRKYYGNNVANWLPNEVWFKFPKCDFDAQKCAEVQEELDKCKFNIFLEKLLNDKIEDSSHHVLYKSVSGAYSGISGTNMAFKRILHISGVEAIANLAGVNKSLVSNWTEIGISRKNAERGAGPLGSIESGFYVAADGNDQPYLKYQKWVTDNTHIRGIGAINPEVLKAILGAVVAALSAAAIIVSSINQKKAGALASAQGFGTNAYTPEVTDLFTQQQSGSNDNWMMYVAAAAGAYFLLDDEN